MPETITEAEEEQASPGTPPRTPPPSAATSPSPPVGPSPFGSRATSPEAGSPDLPGSWAGEGKFTLPLDLQQSPQEGNPFAGSPQAGSPGSPPRYEDAVMFGGNIVRADSPGEEEV